MRTAKAALTVGIVLLAIYVLLFRVPWYVGVYRTGQVIFEDEQFAKRIEYISAFGQEWEDRLAFTVFLRPFVSSPTDPVVGLVMGALKSISSHSLGVSLLLNQVENLVALQDSLHLLADLSRVENVTVAFLDTPSKQSLQELEQVYQDSLADLQVVENQLDAVVTATNELRTFVTPLDEQLNRLSGVFPDSVDALRSLLALPEQYATTLVDLQTDLEACQETMQRVTMAVGSMRRVEAPFYATPLEDLLKVSNITSIFDPPLLLLGILVLLRLNLALLTKPR